MDWKRILTRAGGVLDEHLDQLRSGRRLARASAGTIDIVPYRGFASAQSLALSGRVLVQKRIIAATDRESIWQNLLHSYQRLQSDEIPGARVGARIVEHNVEVTSDSEGYFHLRLAFADPQTLEQPWHPVELELLEPRGGGSPVRAVGEVLVPPANAQFGVISDLDDTVIQTGAANLLTMLRVTLLESARSRLPFEGVAEFYRALWGGTTGMAGNPVFYVSSSPWNLYDLLTEFLATQEIPAGPLLLGDFGLDEAKWIHLPHQEHKREQIRRVLDTYPNLPFILIGDSGQKDPEIYWDIVRSDPARIRAVYIRDVTTPERDEEVHLIAENINATGVEMLLVTDTSQAFEHARKSGWIASG